MSLILKCPNTEEGGNLAADMLDSYEQDNPVKCECFMDYVNTFGVVTFLVVEMWKN